MGRGLVRTIVTVFVMAVSMVPAAHGVAAADDAAWSGIYAGLSLGGRWADTTWRTRALAADAAGTLTLSPSTDDVKDYDSAGPRIGALAGYNRQFARTWVAGIEGDVAWGDGREAHDGIPGTGIVAFGITDERFRVDQTTVRHLWDGSLRARLGYLLTPGLLAYATGGAAWQAVEVRAQCGGTLPAWCLVGNVRDETERQTRMGWTVGGGVEMTIAGSWVARLEYRYADFARFAHTFFADTIDAVDMDLDVRTHTASVAIIYRFGWPR